MSKSQPVKVIAFLSDEKALNYKYRVAYPLRSDISVKSYEFDYDSLINSGIKFIGKPPTDGAIYFLHPYRSNEYIHQSNGEMYFLEEKLELYRKFGSLLGAKSIKTRVELVQSERIELDNDGNVRVKLVEFNLSSKNQKESIYKKTLEISENYKLLENFDITKNITSLQYFIKEYNLDHEQQLISLINARDFNNSGTSLINRTIKSEISSEYNQLLGVSAQLSAPIFGLSYAFKKSLQSLNRINIEIEFKF